MGLRTNYTRVAPYDDRLTVWTQAVKAARKHSFITVGQNWME